MTTEGGNWKDLLKASTEGNIPLIRYHLQRGVDPNFQHAEYFTCPIFEAIRNSHSMAVKILIEEGNADPNILEELSDQTPIEVALEAKEYDIVDYLNSKLPLRLQHKIRHVLITGGNRGIGKMVIERLLNRGHHVVFVCRKREVGEFVKDELIKTTKNSKVDYLVGDLRSIQSTILLAKSICSTFPSINVLIHNAGVSLTKYELNVDGLEQSFCINYLFQYVLTQEVIPLLKKNSPDSRIIFMSDEVYEMGTADLIKTPYGKDFSRRQTYRNTKECGVILFLNTARQLRDTGITVNAIHPGCIDETDLDESRQSHSSSCCDTFSRYLINTVYLGKGGWVDATGPVWLAESLEASKFHGTYFNGMRKVESLKPSVINPAVQRDWELWTTDFLNCTKKQAEEKTN